MINPRLGRGEAKSGTAAVHGTPVVTSGRDQRAPRDKVTRRAAGAPGGCPTIIGCAGLRRDPEPRTQNPEPDDACCARPTAAPAHPLVSAVPAGFGQNMVSGSMWMIGSRWAMRLVGLVSTMILARLLAPDDFGLIAMVMLGYGLLETISYAGVDLALMRGGFESRDYFDTAWTVQIMQGLFIALCLLLSAPLVAAYFNEPRAVAVIFWVAARAVIEGLQNIGVVAFRKELDFAKEFRFTLYVKLLNFAIVVGAAFWLRNYWALILGSLAAAVIGVVLSYLMHPYRPRLSLAKIREIWSFSQWLMISRVGSFLNRKCDEFIVGGVAGSAAMGNYHVANELATLPSSELVMPIRRAMFPTLSKMAGQKDEFVAAVTASFSAVAALCLFVSFCLLLVAPELVSVVLGNKWLAAAPLIQWLALFGGFSALVLVLEVPLWVAGKTNLSAAQTWLELAAIVPLTLLAVQHFGVEGAAAARAAVSVAMVPVMMLLTARSGSVPFASLWAALWRPLCAALAMAAVAHWLPWSLLPSIPLRLAAKITWCVFSYPALLLALWWLSGQPAGFEKSAIQFSKARLRRA